MTIQSKLFQRGDVEWQAKRSRFITGTDMASLFGLNQYSSPAKIFAYKKSSTFTDNEFTRMGRILEPAVGEAVLESLGKEVKFFAGREGNLIYFDEDALISATPDGYIGQDVNNIDNVVELKTTSPTNIKKWYSDPPLHYFMQLATQCYLVGVPKGLLAVMSPVYPTLPVLIFNFDVPSQIYDLMKSEVQRFWANTSDSGTKYRVCSKSKVLMSELISKNVSVLFEHKVVEPPPVFQVIDWNA